jgi:diguanylate cyclase (GGDEF)-like protein
LRVEPGIAALWVLFLGGRALELSLYPATADTFLAMGGDVTLVIFITIAAMRVDWSRRQAFARLRLSETRAYFDQLTGLYNRWGFQREVDRIIRQAVRESHPLTMVLVDIDHFKQINDVVGHVFGDLVLSRIGHCLATLCRRPLDAAGRFGGDEFMLLFYAPREGFSTDIGQQILAGIRALELRHPDAPELPVTVSIGAATLTPRTPEDVRTLKHMADDCLYQAKRAGRDRCESAGCGQPDSPERNAAS